MSVLDALENIYQTGPVPRKIRSDRGLEFRNSALASFFSKKGIRHVYASPPIKAGYAERCIQTLKQPVYPYLFHNNTFTYVDVLDQLVSSYSSRAHRSLGMTAPNQVNERNQVSLWNDMYINSLRLKKKTSTPRRTTAPKPKYALDKG